MSKEPCKKCGHRPWFRRPDTWHAGVCVWRNNPKVEPSLFDGDHMHYWCSRCGFEWGEQPWKEKQ